MATTMLERDTRTDAPVEALPKAISADSHVIEPLEAFSRYIDPAFRDRVPTIVHDEVKGDQYAVEGLPGLISIPSVSACGKSPRAAKDAQGKLEYYFEDAPPPYPDAPFAGSGGRAPSQAMGPMTFADTPRGGWQAAARLEAQDRDGVIAEVLYPTLGMVLCNHPDSAFQSACFRAYNRWLAELVADAPTRLFGIGQTALTSVGEGIEDLRRIKEMGFVGVMLPGDPPIEADWFDEEFYPLWEAAIYIDLPLSFHTLASGRNRRAASELLTVGKKKKNVNFGMEVLRANQDAITDFVLGGVFERFPALKLVCVEAGAGWIPDYINRMDHFYDRHRALYKVEDMERLPSEYFFDNVYVTFQDDPVALSLIGQLNAERLLWANDYPHSDATWPWSRNILAEQTRGLTEEQRRWLVHDNVKELYGLPVG
jgi:predicted TIM-barrel fold metal-dependent hydrolase